MIPKSPNPFNTSLSTRLSHSSWNLASPPAAWIAPWRCSRTNVTRLSRCTGSEYKRMRFLASSGASGSMGANGSGSSGQ